MKKEDNGDVEAFLDGNVPEPSGEPLGSPLPPLMLEEPVKKVRHVYVKKKDVDPAAKGIGFTPGCLGCIGIINWMPGGRSVTHSEDCRLRTMERAETDSSVAARVQATQARDLGARAKLLEAADKRKKEGATTSSETLSTGDGAMEE